ncbi:MAG: bifunctional adenosylcobinamide kinase/adenosylcobinamide-phosphate guanylyltransferase [Oscillospiraceae bacterium]|jgi:adenosyl cobinamide kinase/adenosyl cobinamide phosphate guanylyltransferase|nr:bifunctional adenosylcobinamide kinase/adenosylcobinamide-phosphate guanylyltransferase [Oscillospiraceae bacterium]
MKLIIGGAYQGKLDYALSHYGFTRNDVHFCAEDETALVTDKPVLYGFERWVLALVRSGRDVRVEVEAVLPRLSDKVVIATDISAGVVPIDPVIRAWREDSGRATVRLAGVADEVVRLFVGLPTKLK